MTARVLLSDSERQVTSVTTLVAEAARSVASLRHGRGTVEHLGQVVLEPVIALKIGRARLGIRVLNNFGRQWSQLIRSIPCDVIHKLDAIERRLISGVRNHVEHRPIVHMVAVDRGLLVDHSRRGVIAIQENGTGTR